MHKYIIQIILLAAVAFSASAQSTDSLYLKHITLDFNIGASFSFGNDALSQKILGSNNLVADIGFKYYFSKHWGAVIDITSDRAEYDYNDLVQATIPLFVENPVNSYCVIDNTQHFRCQAAILTGLVYRYLYKRWNFNLSLGLGVTTISLDGADEFYTIKELGSTKAMDVHLQLNKRDFLISSPEFSISYHMGELLSLGVRMVYYQSFSSAYYNYKVTNIYNDEVISEGKHRFRYPSRLRLGATMSFNF